MKNAFLFLLLTPLSVIQRSSSSISATTFDSHGAPLRLAAKRHIAQTKTKGLLPKGSALLSEAVVRKLKPALLRVVVALAKEQTLEEIARSEQITLHGVAKRLDRIHKLVGRQSTFGAYRVLLLAGIIVID